MEAARSRRAARVLETAHPPSFYLPWDDAARRLPGVTWSSQPLAGAEALADYVVFLIQPAARLPSEFLRCRKSRSIRPR